MAKRTLYNKVWDLHKIGTLANGQDQIFIGLHLIHEVTSPQAFAMLKERNSKIKFPQRTFATMDHVIPTTDQSRPFADPQGELMTATLEKNAKKYGFTLFDLLSNKQGVIHVMGPERGLTQPGMTIACGDSHTSTHGAFGALAFGIGTTQVRDVLETQTIALSPLKVRKIEINGKLPKGVFAKDVILKVIRTLGVNGGIGYAYEFAGDTIKAMTMEERLTICNMAIEGGARIGYINPDETTFEYLQGKEYAPKKQNWNKALEYWKSIVSDDDAVYDDVVVFDVEKMEPQITWGITPAQSIGISETIPQINDFAPAEQGIVKQAYEYMNLKPGSKLQGLKVDIVFIGSCTNGRMKDLQDAAKILKGRKISDQIECWVVPGSQELKKRAEDIGLDKIFIEAGAQWRNAGCSLCLAMNPDKLKGNQISISTSNRNFIGRQGSPNGRTILASPAMAAVAAIEGQIGDVRNYL